MRPQANRRPGIRDERGAVLLVVALTLLTLIGSLVLVVDLGFLVAKKRALVQAADAAALAAALSCGQAEGPGMASSMASSYTVNNEPFANVVGGYPKYFPRCNAPAGFVTVQVELNQPLFFSPALGLGNTRRVVAEATASWGGAGVGERVAPLMISAYRLSDCEIPPPPEAAFEEKLCTFWWDNSPAASTDPALANAEWGTLDLNNWNVAGNAQCNNSTPPEFSTWMFQGFFLPLPINNPPPTYVCRGQGNFGASLDNMLNQAKDLGLRLYFPVNDPAGLVSGYPQVDKDGNPCPPADPNDPSTWTNCSPDKYQIIGFAQMVIEALYKGNTPEAETHCISRVPGAEKDANARCMILRWKDYTTEGLEPQEGQNFGVVPIQLVK